MKNINILFVCKYNGFRSRIAEAYFKKINKNKNIKVKSAGIIKGRAVGGKGVNIAKNKYGLNIKGKSQLLSNPLLLWQDIIVIVADNVPTAIFNEEKKQGKKVIVFKIKDVGDNKKRTDEKVIKQITKKIDKLIKKIMKKVDNLPKQLEKKK